MNEYINISRIENWLVGRLRETVSGNVYAGDVPSTMSDWKDLAVVDTVQVKDKSEYGRNIGEALVNVWVYVKPSSSGRKDVATMNKLENALATLIETDRDEHYTMSELYSEQDYDRNMDYHYKMTALKILIR